MGSVLVRFHTFLPDPYEVPRIGELVPLPVNCPAGANVFTWRLGIDFCHIQGVFPV